MAFTQADLDAIRANYAKGIKSVSYDNGKRVDFQSRAEMLATIKDIEAELATGKSRRPKVRLAEPR